MPRARRHFFPGATYHVILRGNQRQPIFYSDDERERFCQLLAEGVERYDHHVVAYCLMTNHIHLAVRAGEVPLSSIFHNLAFRYTRYFNAKHDTCGHLFQGRYKSIPVQSEGHMRALLCYIHLNPVRAKMVEAPQDYKWCSYRAFLGKEELPWLTPDLGLSYFGKTSGGSTNAFHKFVMSGIGCEERIDPDTGELVIGIEVLMDEVLEWHSLNRDELTPTNRSRVVTQAQAVAVVLARKVKGITLDEVAEFFGRQPNSLLRVTKRFESRMEASPALSRSVDSLYEGMFSNVHFGAWHQSGR